MALPARRDITQYRGDTLAMVVRLWQDGAHTVPVDLTGATVQAQVRTSAVDEMIAATFGISIADNAVTLTLTPSQTRDLPANGVWDCEVDWQSDGQNLQTVLAGSVVVTQDVTRLP